MKTDLQKKQRKLSLNSVRLIVQLLFFIVAPAPFAIAYAGIKGLFIKIGAGEAVALSAMLQLSIAMIIFTFLFGRFFCGWACAFGTYTDIINRIAKKLRIRQIQNKLINRFLPKLKYIIAAAVLLLCFFGQSGRLSGKSVWDVFAKITAGNFYLSGYLIGVIVFLFVTAGSVFIERFFCRFFCPMGAVFALSARLTPTRLKKKQPSCGKCGICTSACPAGINLYEMDAVRTGECLSCMKCTKSCPRDNVGIYFFGKKLPVYVIIIIQIICLAALLFWFRAVRI